MRYRADITAGSLKVPESRGSPTCCSTGPMTRAGRTPSSTRTFSRPAARRRPIGWPADPRPAGDDGRGPVEARPGRHGPVATHAVWRRRSSTARSWATSSIWSCGTSTAHRRLSNKLWDDYLDDCRGRDPDMPRWNESTTPPPVLRLPDARPGRIHREHRTLKLQTVHIAQQVLDYLKDHDEEYVLRCIQVAP